MQEESVSLASGFVTSPFDVEAAVESCMDCGRLCLETLPYCVARGQPRFRELAGVLAACSRICQIGAETLITSSELAPITCRACVDACEKLAKLLKPYEDEDQIQGCAHMARECAAACRAVLVQAV